MDIEPAAGKADAAPTQVVGSESPRPAGGRRRSRRGRSRQRPHGTSDPAVRAPVPSGSDLPIASRGSTVEGLVTDPGTVAAVATLPPEARPGAPGDAPEETGDAPTEAPPLPPLLLREGLPPLVETRDGLAATLAALQQGSGPLAIDTERASGYRYGQRAYLIQIRRAGSGTHLIDPIAVPGLPGLADALAGPEWILHAATQDLPCLLELDLVPSALFDTELAGRLLGMPRVGLAPMVADVLGRSLAKGHGAADWSRRPLPQDWLEYAALDVEVLPELRDELTRRLVAAGKLEWALEEFEAIRTAAPAEPRTDPWRRTGGIHQVRSRRGLAVVRELWEARDEIARQVDMAPGRLLPDASIIVAATALPRDIAALRAQRSFHGRGAARYQREWGRALEAAWAVAEDDLPRSALRGDGPPPPRAWAQRDRAAAARLDRARTALAVRSEALEIPVENLVSPLLVRKLVWDPQASTEGDVTPEGIARFLTRGGARRWQVEQVGDLLAQAIRPA